MRKSLQFYVGLVLVCLSVILLTAFFVRKSNLVLVVVNPINNTQKTIKVNYGKKFEKYLSGEEQSGYQFYGYYNNKTYDSQINLADRITKNTTVVCGFVKQAKSVAGVDPNMLGIKFEGELTDENLSYILSLNFSVIDLQNATISGNFYPCTSVKTLVLPQTETLSGINGYINLQKVSFSCTNLSNSLNNCPKLTEVNFSAKNISNSFNNCPSLESLRLPANLESVTNSFNNSNLSKLVSASNNFVVENSNLYYKSGDDLKLVLAKNNQISNNTTIIGSKAFYQSNISEINLSNTKVRLIEENAFENSNICSIKFSEQLESISSRAFSGCKNLTELNFGGTLLSNIGSYAFENCAALKSVTFSSSTTTFGEGAFYNCTGLNSVGFFKTENISNFCFYNCTSLKTIEYVNSLQTIGDYAFFGCKNLENLDWVYHTTTIGQSAFENCQTITDVTLLSVNSIGSRAFRGCKNLQNFACNQSITNFDNSWFEDCRELSSLSMHSDESNFVISGGLVYNNDSSQIIFAVPSYSYPSDTITISSGVNQVESKFLAAAKVKKFETQSNSFAVIGDVLFTADNTLIAYPSELATSQYVVPMSCQKIDPFAFSYSAIVELKIENQAELGKQMCYNLPILQKLVIKNISSDPVDHTKSFIGYMFGASFATENGQYLPQSLISIVVTDQQQFDAYAFYQLLNVTTLELSNCTTLNEYCLYGCSKLTSLTLGKMEYFGSSSVASCSKLQYMTVRYYENIMVISGAFSDVGVSTRLTITCVYKQAEYSPQIHTAYRQKYNGRTSWQWSTRTEN